MFRYLRLSSVMQCVFSLLIIITPLSSIWWWLCHTFTAVFRDFACFVVEKLVAREAEKESAREFLEILILKSFLIFFIIYIGFYSQSISERDYSKVNLKKALFFKRKALGDMQIKWSSLRYVKTLSVSKIFFSFWTYYSFEHFPL